MRQIQEGADIVSLLQKYIITLRIDKTDFPLKPYEVVNDKGRFSYIPTTLNPQVLERLGLDSTDGNLYNLQTKNVINLDRYTKVEFYLEDNFTLQDIQDDTVDLELFFSRLL